MHAPTGPQPHASPAPAGPSPTRIFDALNAFQQTEALRAALELDLFTPLAAGPLEPAALARACGADPRGVRILADFLVLQGFLAKHGSAYGLTPDAAAFLVRSSPACMAGLVDFLLSPDLRGSFDRLAEAVRRGGTALAAEGTVSHENPVWVTFARAMAPMMRPTAGLLAGLLAPDPARPLRVLDVAAGHGLFGLALAAAHPQAHVTALDWPGVLQVAAENARAAGAHGRYALKPGSAFEVDWGGPYDLVLLTNFLHHFDPETCVGLARRARAALAPGGRCATLEFVPDEGRVSPPTAAAFALTMLATTPRGDAYTFEEYRGIFARAGFAHSRLHALPPTPQHAIVSHTA
ncbi:MAG: methyltransferase [Planctomycetia bacterium]